MVVYIRLCIEGTLDSGTREFCCTNQCKQTKKTIILKNKKNPTVFYFMLSFSFGLGRCFSSRDIYPCRDSKALSLPYLQSKIQFFKLNPSPPPASRMFRQQKRTCVSSELIMQNPCLALATHPFGGDFTLQHFHRGPQKRATGVSRSAPPSPRSTAVSARPDLPSGQRLIHGRGCCCCIICRAGRGFSPCLCLQSRNWLIVRDCKG